MAPEQKQPPLSDGKGDKTTGPEQPKPKPLAAISVYALPIALAVSILANFGGVFYFRAIAARTHVPAPSEIPLGNYQFVAEEHEPGQVTEAEFALHIELIRQAEQPARRMLQARRQKVRQNVEELLRTAHGGDFSDPELRELKDQLQKRINETLGLRAVADVIVTELHLERAQRPALADRETVRRVPWVEPPAS